MRSAVVAGSVLLAACTLTRPVPRVRYYTLTVPGPPPASPSAPVEVGRFTADPPYDTARIAYRTSPYRLDYYVYHRWAAEPPQLLAMSVRDYLEKGPSADGAAPYVLEGHVRRLEEEDGPDGWRGVLALDVTVRRDGRVVLQRSFTESEPAERRAPEAVAAALSRALGRALDAVLAGIDAGAGHRSPGPEGGGATEAPG